MSLTARRPLVSAVGFLCVRARACLGTRFGQCGRAVNLLANWPTFANRWGKHKVTFFYGVAAVNSSKLPHVKRSEKKNKTR